MFNWGQQLLQQGQNIIRSIQENSSDTVQEFVNTLHNPPQGDMQFVSGHVPIFSHSFRTQYSPRSDTTPPDGSRGPSRDSSENGENRMDSRTEETTGPRTQPPRHGVDVNLFFENLLHQMSDAVEQIQVHQATQASTRDAENNTPATNPLSTTIIDKLPRIRGADVVMEYGREHTCSICLETSSTRDCLIELPCKHAFHENCILEWFQQQSICPICRNEVKPEVSEEPPTVPDPPSSSVLPDAQVKNIVIRVRISSQHTERVTIKETATPRDVLRQLGRPTTNSVLCANQRLSLDESLISQGICDHTLLVIW